MTTPQTSRRPIVLSLALALALLVSACGSGSTTGASSSASTATTPTASASTTSAPDDTSAASSPGPTADQPSPTPASTSASSAPAAPDAVDALSLTGPATAAVVPDMRQVVTDPRPTLPTTVTDAKGTDITVTAADRVIALDLYGTLVDTMIGLGLQDRLIGRAASDTQDALHDLPVVSNGGIELNAEAVLNLGPDLVLTNMTIGSDPVYRQLEAAGITVVRFDEVPSIAGIADAINEVAAVFGMVDQAEELIAQLDADFTSAREQIAALTAETPRPPRGIVLYVRGSAGLFFILGSGYGAADLLHELGLEDVAKENGIDKLTPASPEALVRLDPEIILTMTKGLESGGGVEALLKRPGIGATTAGRNQRIITADDAQLLSYGPRTPANLVALAHAIYEPAH